MILAMSATGALLALKPQILNVIERDARFVQVPQPGAPPVGMDRVLAAARASKPDAQAVWLAVDRDPAKAAAVSFGRDATVWVDPYSGQVLGEGSKGATVFFRAIEDWHRWLGRPTENRVAARAITDACNLAFLCLAASGLYLWWPKSFTWRNLKAVLLFRRAATVRARDFNWHNVIGFWCAPVIVIMAATGAVISYPWATNLLYRAMGSTPPQAAGARSAQASPAQTERGERRAAASVDLDQLWARAEQQLPTWSAITLRLPTRPGGPVSFTITDGESWNAFARSTLTLDAATGAIAQWQPYGGQSLGQRARGWARFAHTGELGRLPGQVIAGVASAGAVVLVWTGLALALRRFLGWRPWKLRVNWGHHVPAAANAASASAARATILE
ncbi:MAG: hypothetical protein A3H95_13590 [Acidobacteria bacterium RIFCSPLOWO2_02_FULL_64_15]|nr:MAG: hypothetical protein A3H95_13590 [Acidobacteria bacterium RIFCSPLOWO2_02_FULL_64_15]